MPNLNPQLQAVMVDLLKTYLQVKEEATQIQSSLRYIKTLYAPQSTEYSSVVDILASHLVLVGAIQRFRSRVENLLGANGVQTLDQQKPSYLRLVRQLAFSEDGDSEEVPF